LIIEARLKFNFNWEKRKRKGVQGIDKVIKLGHGHGSLNKVE
jgi:hypothetical protein